MTYDNELTLLSSTITYDDIGNPIQEPIEVNILCGVKSIGRTEFYNASANGLKPEYIFVVHPYEYSGETYVEFSEDSSPKQRYKVIKTYKKDMEELELTCEKVIGNG
jgi:hypothetical protein